MDPMKLDELEQILRILKQNDVADFELEANGVHLKLSRGVRAVQSSAVVPLTHAGIEPAIQLTQPVTASAPKEDHYAGMTKVESPIVGTFYRKSSPDAEPFVKEGSLVKKGDTLCIIEAMKIMNEIEAPQSGKIAKVLLDDGQVVEFGEVLFIIDPN